MGILPHSGEMRLRVIRVFDPFCVKISYARSSSALILDTINRFRPL